MKKLVLGAALAVSSLTFAQQFGIKGGMNVSSLSNDAGLEDSSSKIGFNAGVFLNAPLAANFSIQPEVLYNNLGSKVTLTDFDINNDNYTAEYARHLDYISVPVMFQYNATPSFYLEAGPQFSYMLLSKYKSNSLTTENNADDLNKFDFGVGAGLGYWITPNLGVNARYIAGITDIVKDNNSDKKVRNNNNVQVGLSFKFK